MKKREHHFGKLFITDVIINKTLWNSSKIKILYILKEAYESDPDEKIGWDLCAWLDCGLKTRKKKMWWTLAQLSYGINKLIETNEVAMFDEKFKNNDTLVDAFLGSAVINIKYRPRRGRYCLPLEGDTLPFAPKRGTAWVPRFIWLKQTLLLGHSFLSLLVFYVFTYFLGIKSDRIYAITLGPKMITPIGFLL
jgi:hypothetical protein